MDLPWGIQIEVKTIDGKILKKKGENWTDLKQGNSKLLFTFGEICLQNTVT